MSAQTLFITDHDRAEWARMAQAAYKNGHNATGHRFSVASAIGDVMPLARFDSLQRDYRAWLVFNEYPETSEGS